MGITRPQATIAILNSIINNLSDEEKDDGLDIYLRYAIACVKQDIAFTEENGLKSTIMYMISDNYKERFKAEYKQLVIRREKLADLIEKYAYRELEFKLDTPINILIDQWQYMTKYLCALIERAKYEDINLD